VTAADESPLERGLAWTLVLAATATMAVSYVDRQALAVLSPTITAALHLSEQQYGWVTAAFSFSFLVCAPLAGGWIDRVGARRGLLISMVVWSAVAAAHALVPGAPASVALAAAHAITLPLVVLILLRLLLGVAEAPSFPGAAQTVARVLPPADRAAGFGLLFTGSSIGAALAPLLAVPLAARFGWRYALVATAVCGLGWLPLWAWVTSPPAVRAAMADRHGDGSDGSDSVRRIDLLRHPGVLRAVALVLASAPINGFAINWSAKALTAAHQVPQAAMSRYLWLPPLLFDGGALAAGALASLIERRRDPTAPHRGLVAVAVLLLCSIGVLGLARTPWQSTAVIATAFAGGGMCYALCTADMLKRVARSQVATAGGLTASAQAIALIISNPLIGLAADHAHGYRGIAIALALLALPGAAIWLAWDPREK
jgi:ACS family hexuronate transporter-like MFS transporter